MKKFFALLLACLMLVSVVSCTVRKDDGKFENFPTLTYLYNDDDMHKAIGEYVQAALSGVGINLKLEVQEWNTFLNTRKNGDYSIARNGWLADYNDPICFLDMWTTISGNNDVQFGKGAHANLAMYDLDLTAYGYDIKVENGTWAQTYDVLISTIKSCTNAENRYAMMHIAEDMLMATGCIVPIFFYTDLYMLDDSVKGFYSNPLGYKYFMYSTIEGSTTNTIDVCLASEPDTLDPALNSAVDGATMLAHLFSGLAKWSQDENGNLIITADCATELPEGVINDDGTVTYTYTLRDGLKWSNGDDLTAADFEFAWKRAADAELGADYGYMFEIVKGYDTGDLAVEAVDAKTLKVTLSNRVDYWNELLAFPTYYPVHEATVANESWATSPATYVCNGPYTMSNWEHDSVITLTKNENYYDAANITMDTIKCHLSDDANNMLANFKNGAWQLIDSVPVAEIATLKTDYPTEFFVAGQIGTYYLCWNINENILPKDSKLTGVEAEKAQAEIRNAIGLLINRQYVCDEIAQGGQVPASSFVAMGMTNPDGTEFYKTANGGAAANNYVGYFDATEDALESNHDKAMEVLKKYYK